MSIEFNIKENIATITLNRPEKMNALTDQIWDLLACHLERCENDGAINAVILTGAGRGFSAGADLSGEGRIWQRKPGIAGTLATMQKYNAVINKLYHLPKPVIAAVRGPVIGIAWTLVLCCDWILVAESAKFRPAFLNLAKVPEGGFQFLASRLAGQLKVRDIIYRAKFVTGSEAVELGLANQLLSDDEILPQAELLAREIALSAPVAFALTKRLINENSGDFDQYVEKESYAIAIAANTEDAREGMAAFAEKRPAQYQGI